MPGLDFSLLVSYQGHTFQVREVEILDVLMLFFKIISVIEVENQIRLI